MYAWWPHKGAFKDRYKKDMEKLDKEKSTKAIIPDNRTFIPCRTWEIDWDPAKLPMLPDLPDLLGTGLPEEERRKETKLIKIAAHYNHLIRLTNKGHVLGLSMLDNKDSAMSWHYMCKSAQTILYLYSNGDTQLPNYSEIDKVKEHPAFHTTIGDDGEARSPKVKLSPNIMLITHVGYIASISSEFRV